MRHGQLAGAAAGQQQPTENDTPKFQNGVNQSKMQQRMQQEMMHMQNSQHAAGAGKKHEQVQKGGGPGGVGSGTAPDGYTQGDTGQDDEDEDEYYDEEDDDEEEEQPSQPANAPIQQG